jgi:tetratricopeptide (TPR) repeat protein/predicted Ser/Thr protein kinase
MKSSPLLVRAEWERFIAPVILSWAATLFLAPAEQTGQAPFTVVLNRPPFFSGNDAGHQSRPSRTHTEGRMMSTIIGQVVSHYRIIEKLGGGGMGVVYKAEDTRLRRPVALKFLADPIAEDRSALERFEREAQAASALNHPGICTIYQFEEHNGRSFLAMELIEGWSLRAFRERDASLESLTRLVGQAAAALAAAHGAGIVHRDIKPENIMVRNDSYVKLVDFGLARFTDQSTESTLVTSPGAVVGTVRYMSPEQVRGEPVSSASDIFSLGIVMYEFATGHHPFSANSPAEVMSAILSEAPPVPSQLNPEISPVMTDLILQMLQKDPQLRPTAAEICAALASPTAIPLPGIARYKQPQPARAGREKERAELWKAYRDVVGGQGLLACLAGEPGIGKTTIAEAFLEDLANTDEACFVARGRCSERLAGSEAYLPLLEALDSLLQQGRSQTAVIRTMKALAPAWFAQVASGEAGGGSERDSRQPQTVSQEQLKRQLGTLFRELSRTAPVVLFLDDLHWADTSTVDLLAYLATKFAESRLFVLVTYRPSDLRIAKHPFLLLKLDLEARGICRDMEVAFLTSEEIESYLTLELPGNKFPTSLAKQLHSRTEGNPLFLVNLVSDLRERQVIVQQGGQWILRIPLDSGKLELPVSIRSMIERKKQKLSEDDRRLLEAASVQGYEFDSVILAEVLGLDVSNLEDRLAPLEQVHRFVRSAGETDFPDQTASSHYRFIHILYQNAFYNSLLPTRRRTLSRNIAHALQQHSGLESAWIAGQLAMLYEAGREFRHSSHYFLLAAKNAARLSAHHEAAKLARRGLEQLKSLPEDTERMKQELDLQNALGHSLHLIEGYGFPEVEQVFRRAQDLAQKTGQPQELIGILRGLCFYYGIRGRLSPWRSMQAQVLDLARQSGDPGLQVLSYHLTGDVYLFLGDFAGARQFLLKGVNLYRAERDRSLPDRFGAYDLLVGCRMFLGHALWYLGYPDQARDSAEEAVRWAREIKHAYSVAASAGHCAWVYILRGEPRVAQERAQECFQVSTDHSFPFHIAHAKAFRGWALAEQGDVEGGAAEIQEGIEIYRGTGSIIEHPFMAMLLASALVKAGHFDAAVNAIDTALDGFDDSPLFCDAELARWRGELLLATGADGDEIEQCFRKALETARRQKAKSLELRAATSLSHFYRDQGRNAEAREALTDVYRWFSEGFDTLDLNNARVLLEAMR